MVRLSAYIAALVLLLVAAPMTRGASAPAGVTLIQGQAWTADNRPLSGARLRLRNVETGKTAGATRSNEDGRFIFANVGRGSYLVELLNETGGVLAVGHVFSIAPGETVGTSVRLESRLPWFAALFANAAGAVAQTAASQGIAAIAPLARPASAGR